MENKQKKKFSVYKFSANVNLKANLKGNISQLTSAQTSYFPSSFHV